METERDIHFDTAFSALVTCFSNQTPKRINMRGFSTYKNVQMAQEIIPTTEIPWFYSQWLIEVSTK